MSENSNGSLLKQERHNYILKQVNLHNKVSSTSLSMELQVSDDTIRRDLAELAAKKEIIKVYGGALSKSYHFPSQQSAAYAQTKKKKIARKALKLIRNGMVVLTEAGTTMLELVRIIPEDLEATFFTVSPFLALELAKHPSLTVFLIGGQLDISSQIVVGEKPVSELADIKVDLCLLGANALDAKEGLTEVDWRVVQVKKAMVKAAAKLAVITISEKLNTSLKMKVCAPSAINYLVTELDPDDKRLFEYRKNSSLL